MSLAEKFGLDDNERISIDWDLTPAETFGIFESWGGRFRVHSDRERYYYFYIDGWQEPASLFLMERGIKHAKVLAQIFAPQELIDAAVAGQGKGGFYDRSYAIDTALKNWLKEHIIDTDDDSKIVLIDNSPEEESLQSELPDKGAPHPAIVPVGLRSTPGIIHEDEVAALVRQGNFYDSRHHAAGGFENYLVDNGDGLTVTDLKTGLMWQRGGCDITTIRNVQRYVERLNVENFAGHHDWRLPTMEEGLSLMETERNDKGLHLHPCFSREQPFIFLADRRKPGGVWFIDYKQGSVFWASGTIPGGFGRVCRTAA